MRVLAALLLVLLVVLVLWSFAIAPDRGWWPVQGVSSIAPDVDGLFAAITALLAVALTGTIGWLAWVVARRPRAADGARRGGGDARLEVAWTAVTGLILAAVAFAQLSVWDEISSARSSQERPIARVLAAQWDWRFRYPGPDGRLDTSDDFETPYRLVVPVDERVVLALHSRDVIHGFFVPAFRVKQDVVPGLRLATWFEAREVGEYDLLCSQMCGAGHYRMVGKVRVVSRAEFDAWQAEALRAWNSNGKDRP